MIQRMLNVSVNSTRRMTILSVLLVLAVTALAYVSSRTAGAEDETAALKLGDSSTISSPTKLSFVEPMSFNEMTKEEILTLRHDMVNRYPDLIEDEYTPSDFVFSGIEDGLPWYSISGFYFWGQGKRTTEGTSKDAYYVMNPFLLLGVEFWDLSVWDKGNLKWDTTKISEELLKRKRFPFFCKPSDLMWDPKHRSVSVTYDISSHLKLVNLVTKAPPGPPPYHFGLIAYNARDFGFRYMYPRMAQSKNIKYKGPTDAVIANFDHLAAGDGCWNQKPCNHRPMPRTHIDSFSIENLPAKLSLNLWLNFPENTQATPDLVYDITIR